MSFDEQLAALVEQGERLKAQESALGYLAFKADHPGLTSAEDADFSETVAQVNALSAAMEATFRRLQDEHPVRWRGWLEHAVTRLGRLRDSKHPARHAAGEALYGLERLARGEAVERAASAFAKSAVLLTEHRRQLDWLEQAG